MRRKRLFLILGCAAVLIIAGVVVSWLLRPEPLYRVTFLPSMGGVQTCPGGINDSGRVVAAVRMADGTARVVLWDKSGRMEDLASFPKGHSVWALVINNAGQVASTVSDPNHAASSFFWDTDGHRYTLDAPAGEQVRIGALNNRGQVVGHRHATRGPRHAFLWDKAGEIQDLGLPGSPESFACDINDGGQIVGFFSRSTGDWRAFICDPNLGVHELGPTHYDEGSCRINNQGFVVGQFNSSQSGPDVSTWTAPTGPQPLPWKGRGFLQVRGLNDAGCYFVNVSREGIRVGMWKFRRRAEAHLWQSGRHVRRLTVRLCCGADLRHRNVTAVSGWDINKDGTILGAMTVKGSGQWHAVILEPIQ